MLYRDTCGKCRLLSRLAVVAALGRIRRAPASSALAIDIVRRVPVARGKLVLLDGPRLVTGWKVIPSLVLCALRPPVRHADR